MACCLIAKRYYLFQRWPTVTRLNEISVNREHILATGNTIVKNSHYAQAQMS